MKFLFSFCFSSFTLFSISQTNEKNGNVWYFGNRAGVDFNSGSPVGITNGQIDTQEGVAAICDTSGALLFYTDGSTIWDATHAAMPNANGDLDGHWSSTQSAIIVPDQYNYNTYYVFTVDAQGGPNGLKYSTVDMSLAGNGSISSPLGDVASFKNVSLVNPVAEKVVAIRHSNMTDFWIVTHAWNSNEFYVYLVDDNGVNTTPIITALGNPHIGGTGNINSVGYMKASPDGSKLALTNRNSMTIDLFEFDNSNGSISNFSEINPFTASLLYGIEFSSNNSFLFIADGDSMYRYNLLSAIIESVPIDDVTALQVPNGAYRALQIGPDGKIYVSIRDHNYLSVIEDANGPSPYVVADAVFLDGDSQNRHCRFGLPNIYFTREWFSDVENFGDPKKVEFKAYFDNFNKNIMLILNESEFIVSVYSIQGELICRKKNQFSIDAQAFISGVYLISVTDASLTYYPVKIIIP